MMSIAQVFNESRLNWLNQESIRPYVFHRRAFQFPSLGRGSLSWFSQAPLVMDPQDLASVDWTNQILNLENRVFGAKLAMPRWVFYDCAVMPGLTTGFAIKRTAAPPELIEITRPAASAEWVPLSLFIIIPTAIPGEWVAHNLSSVNSALSQDHRCYGLGFLTKAFGLWYANIGTCLGMTHWRGPAIRLHSHYGDLEVLTAYTPSHTVAETLTYRLRVNQGEWPRFFSHQSAPRFYSQYRTSGVTVDRSKEQSLREVQHRIEAGEGPFYLDAAEIAKRPLDSELSLFLPKELT